MTPARLAYLCSQPAFAALALGSLVSGSLSATALSALGYGALRSAGVLLPRLQMYGRILCRGPSQGGEIALTFDDGPHPETTRTVLRLLASTRHRATFFVLGDKVRRHPEVVREIAASGHGLALHGDVHDRLHSFRSAERVREELVRAQDAVERAAGVRPHLFRPPVGHTSPSSVRGARGAGVVLVGWSSRGYDGLRGRSPRAVAQAVCRSLRPGSIVLLHDASERDNFVPAAATALPELFSFIDQAGLTSVTLETWFPASSAVAH